MPITRYYNDMYLHMTHIHHYKPKKRTAKASPTWAPPEAPEARFVWGKYPVLGEIERDIL